MLIGDKSGVFHDIYIQFDFEFALCMLLDSGIDHLILQVCKSANRLAAKQWLMEKRFTSSVTLQLAIYVKCDLIICS